MADYQDRVLEHSADGINEYDNSPPGWLMWILYGSIIFSVLYMAWYALAFGADDYSTWWAEEQVVDRAKVQDWFKDNPITAPSAEVLLAGAVDPAVLETGRVRFGKTCGPCHGEQAQGLIGPNLTDDRWIHGGKVTDVFNTIVKGVPAKGMPSWGRAFKPEELAALASYVRSLRGTTPPNPKAAEGEPAALEPLPK